MNKKNIFLIAGLIFGVTINQVHGANYEGDVILRQRTLTQFMIRDEIVARGANPAEIFEIARHNSLEGRGEEQFQDYVANGFAIAS